MTRLGVVFSLILCLIAALALPAHAQTTPSSNQPPDRRRATDPSAPAAAPKADLKIRVTDSGNVAPGAQLTFTIIVTNTSATNGASPTLVTDTFPAEFAPTMGSVATTGGATSGYAGGNINDTAANLPAGSTITYTVTGTVSSFATPGTLSDTATVTGPNDPNPANDTFTDMVNITTPQADLHLTKTDGITSAIPGTSDTYTITVTNNGPSDAPGSSVTDNFPGAITGVVWIATGTGTASGFTTSGTGDINDTNVSLPAGSSVIYTATGTIGAAATGTLDNTAKAVTSAAVNQTTPGDGKATDSDTLTPTADLQITKTDGVTSAVPGTPLAYTITVTNAGPSKVVGATVMDAFPAAFLGATFTASTGGGSNGFTAMGSGSINDTVNMQPGSSIQYIVTGIVSSAATGTLSNAAVVSAPAGLTDPNPANNSATDTDTLTAQADLRIRLTDGQPDAVPGDSITYTITVHNQGPSDVAAAIVADTFPAVFGETGFTVTPGTTTGSTYAGGNAINDTLYMPAGSTIIYTVTGNVSSSAVGSIDDIATVTAPAGVDTNPANNSDEDKDTLTPQADLQLTKTDGITSAIPGTSDTYTITVTNVGPSDSPGTSVTDNFPGAFNNVVWTATGTGTASGFTASGMGDINDTNVSLPAGSSVIYTATGTIGAAATGTLDNTAKSNTEAGVTDPTPADAKATDSDTLTPTGDLQITKTDGVTSAIPGDLLTYTITVTNAGPSKVVGATVMDVFPAAFLGATFTASTGGGANGFTAMGTGSINDTVNMQPGSSIQYIVTGMVSSAATGTLSNTAVVNAPAGFTDPDLTNNSATDTDTLTAEADLEISKTDGQMNAVPGDQITYTITVTNHGPSDVTGAVVTDTFPVDFTEDTFTVTPGETTGSTYAGGNAINDTLNMPSGSSLTYSITGTVSSSATGTLSNTASVAAPAGVTETNMGNNSATDSDTLTPKAHLKLTDTDGQLDAIPGTSDTYTITVKNNGPSDSPGSAITDTFPANFTSVTWSVVASTGGASGFSASGTGNINDTNVSLPANSSVTYKATGSIPSSATGTLSDTATVTPGAGATDPSSGNDTDTDTDDLTPEGDLRIVKSDGMNNAVPGTPDTYTIVVSNPGPSDVIGATVTDTLPSGFTGDSWMVTGMTGTATDTTSSGTGNLSDIVNLAAESSITYQIVATIDPSDTGTISNMATLTPPATGFTDPDLTNDSSTDTDNLKPQASLRITVNDGRLNAIPGAGDTYTIVVKNNGPSNAPGTAVTDTFPAIFTNLVWSVTASTGGATGFTASGTGNIADTNVNLPAGSSVTYTASGTIASSATGTLSDTATVTPPAGVTDPNPNNDSDTDTDTLLPKADLKIHKNDGQANAVPGTGLTYTIVVTNQGPSDVTGATVADMLPADLISSSFSVTATSGTVTDTTPNGTGNINDTVNMTSGSSITYTLNATLDPSATGTLSNTATVTAPGGLNDPDLTNNSDTDTDTITPVAHLKLTKTDGQANAIPGNSDTYTITVVNNGPSDAPGTAILDTFPAIFTNVTFSAVPTGSVTGFTASGTGNIADNAVNLPANTSITYTATGTIASSATGSLSNSASATPAAGVTDPNPANDTDTDVDTLNPKADLRIQKGDGQANAVPGRQLVYTIIVTNPGPSDVTGATIVDNPPATFLGPTYTSTSTGTASGFTSGSGSINDTVNMAAGSTITYVVSGTVDPAATGTISNTATVTPPNGFNDPNLNNNSNTDTDTLTPKADLKIRKNDGQANAVPGSTLAYTIVVTNQGPSDVVGATVSDTVPADFTGSSYSVTATSGSASDTTPTGTGNLNDTVNLTAGSSITYTVNGTVSSSATGTLSNTATVTAPGTVSDPDLTNNSDTDTDTLTARARLKLTKTDGQMNAVPGKADTYTITVTNNGPSDAPGSAIADTFPAIFTNVTWTATGSGSGFTPSGTGNIADNNVDLPALTSVTYTATGTIDPSATGTLTNTATVTPAAGVTDPNPENDTDTDTDTLTPRAHLRITKDDGVTSINAGSPDTYTITVHNHGPSDAPGAVVADIFPATFLGVTYTATPTGGATGFTASGAGNINDTVNLPAGSTITYQAIGTIDPAATGSISNTATVTSPAGVTDPNPVNNTATDMDTITLQSALAITKTDGKTTASPGTADTYFIIVTNGGPSNVVGAAVADPFPATFTGVTYTATPSGAASGFTASGSGNIADTVNMAAGSSITYTAHGTISASATGTLSNTATVTAPMNVVDPDLSDNTATDSDTLAAAADLVLTGTDSPDPVTAGNDITYTLTLTNSGPADATTVKLTDPLPAGTSFVSDAQISGPAFVCTQPSVGATAGAVICNIATLSASASAVFQVVVEVPSTTADGTVTNTSSVTTDTTDNNLSNNSATETTTVQGVVDLSITKTVSPTKATVGDDITYTIVATNDGPGVATNVTITDHLPEGMTLVSAGLSGAGTCIGTTTVVCNVPSLADAESTTITIVVKTTAPGTIGNTATVTSNELDTAVANNTSTASLTVTPPSIPATGATSLMLLALALAAAGVLVARRQ